MQSSRQPARVDIALSLLGSVLVIYGLFFLPMALGNGGGSFTPTSEWTVANFFFYYYIPPIALLLALPPLLMLFVLLTSVVNLFHELSPGMVKWRRRAAITGLVVQSILGFYSVFIYTFGFDFGVGFWVVLLGMVVMVACTIPVPVRAPTAAR
jgi:hypothetical protein